VHIETLHTRPLLDGLSELLGFRSRVRRLMAARLPGAKCGAVFAPGRRSRTTAAQWLRAEERTGGLGPFSTKPHGRCGRPAGAGAPASRGDLHATPRGIRERVVEDIQRPLVLAHLDLEARVPTWADRVTDSMLLLATPGVVAQSERRGRFDPAYAGGTPACVASSAPAASRV
jgi:hypothetical protein